MGNEFYGMVVPLIAGYILDEFLGDPRKIPHPVVFFGNTIAWAEKRLNRGKGRREKGCMLALGLVFSTISVFAAIAVGAQKIGTLFYCIFATVFVFYGLANRSLIGEGREVIDALETKGLEAGRRRLSWIVGRDTSRLTPKQIYTAVLETMAENLSDGVVAPLFYYALGGFPAMMAYKMANTLDSMIGYRDDRYREFGCCAARLDDVLNFIPARLTAFLMVLVGYRRGLFRFVLRYRHAHASPNAGYPEAAMAGILNCRFGGPHVYHGMLVKKPYIGENNRNLNRRDYNRAVRINQGVTFLSVALIVAFYYFQ